MAVIGVAFAAAGLLFAGAANALSHSATRTINPASVAAGGTVEISIAFDISGFGSVTETLPEGFSYVSSDPAGLGDVDGQDVTFVPFDVPDDTFTYTVTASMDPGDYSFSGTVQDSRKNESDVGGDTDVTVTAAPVTPTEEPTAEPTEEPTAEPTGPNATRSFSSSTVEAGGTLDVTITAANYGDTGLVTETLPAGFSYVSSSPSGLGAESGQEVSFVLIDLEDDTFTYTVTASDVPGAYSFSGTLENFEKTEEVTVGGDSSVTVEAVAGPRASRSLSSTAVVPGGQLRVTIRANDYGASGLVHETLPNGFAYVSSSPSGLGEVNGQVVSFVLLGEDMSFTYTVDAPDMVGDYSFDGELVDFEKDTYPIGGLSSVTVAELPPTALRTISESAVVEGDQFDVTVIAFNYGLAGTLVESLGAGLEYVSSNMADALIVNGQTLTYTLVGNNLSVTYTVEATQTGTHTISGYLQSFDRTIAPVQVSGANSVTVSSATQPPTGGGTYSGPDPTATPVPTETPVPPTATAVPPTATSVPPTATSVPPTATSVPPTATSVPPTATSVPPTATSVPPTATSVPPTATSVPPTATSVPPATATSVPPATATSVPPTATSVPPTATSVPPTATSVPPTATSVPPTATSVPPTATSVPPTATSVPPTATSVPPATATSVPPTATSVPPPPAPTATVVVPPPPEEERGGFPAWAIILIILAVIVVAAGAVVYARQRMMAQQQQA